MTTPCEELDYKVGDKFVVQESDTFEKGSVVSLYKDDGTSYPLFKLISGNCYYKCCNGDAGSYTSLNNVKPCKQSARQVGALIDTQEKWEKMREGDVVEFVGYAGRGEDHWRFTKGRKYMVEHQGSDLGPLDDDNDGPGENYDNDFIFKYVLLVGDNDSQEEFEHYGKQDVEATEELWKKFAPQTYTQSLITLVHETDTIVSVQSEGFNVMCKDSDLQTHVGTLEGVVAILKAIKACKAVLDKRGWV